METTKKRTLEQHERETTLSFDKAGDTAIVFTYERSWQTHLEKAGAEPTLETEYGGKEYEIPKEWVRLPRPRTRRKKK